MFVLLALVLAAPVVPAKAHGKPRPKPAPAVQQAPPPPLCSGDYADALPVERATAIVDSARAPFVYAVRNTATYEHVYYGRDGKLRRVYLRSTVHGTGFGYRVLNGETLLVTNEHVASQPDVTDDEHRVDGVPEGSKKVREQLKIVRDETDDYEPGHIALTRVLVDPSADIAVVKAHRQLGVLPYRIGRSGALRPGNLVQVRGFPLGAFPALNTGKVLNPYTQDSERQWNHADFVVDALLNAGNSGSPVFAISCRTAEPELVGVYHAGYTEAAALNAVVAIDQLREELDTLKVPKRDPAGHSEITASDRDRLVKGIFSDASKTLVFPFGGRAVQAQLTDPSTLRFSILDDDFPLVTQEAMALVDRGATGFGTLDTVAVTVDGQATEVPAQALEGDVKEHFERLYDLIWKQALGVVEYRTRLAKGKPSADAFAESQAVRARLRKRTGEQKELLNICTFEADRGSFGATRAPPLAASAVGPPAPSVSPSIETPVQTSTVGPARP